MEYSLGQRQCSLLAPGDGEPDRISALPDDLLLTILARLGCTSTAACTSVLSRCWSSLWTRLREVILHGVALQPLESVLNHVSPAVSLLEIHVPEDYSPDPAPVSSLLHAAVRLAPEELVLTLPARLVKIDLPRFHRATSITLTSRFLILRVPAAAAGEYCPMLETLSLSGGLIGNLDALLSRCPRLRVLRLVAPNIMIDDKDPMVVHSETLQELFMEAKTAWVDIITPVLKQLTVRLRARKEVSISVLARRVENVSWHCSYIMGSIGFGLWSLDKLRLQTAQGQGQEMQLPSLQIYACIWR